MASIDSSSCRLCLTHPPADSLVFSVYDTFQGRVLKQQIAELFAIQILETDRLLSVCLECVNRINTVHKIRQLFVENDRKLQCMAQNDSTPSTFNDSTPSTFDEEVVYTVLATHVTAVSDLKNDGPILALPGTTKADETVTQQLELNGTSIRSKYQTSTDGELIVSIEQNPYEEHLEHYYDSDTKDERSKDSIENHHLERSDQSSSATTNSGNQISRLPQHKCYFCAVVFRSSLEFIRHLPEHFDQMPYTCPECDGAVFKTVREASKHIGFHDVHERPFKCRVCTLRFPTRVNSLTHERKVHRLKLKRLANEKGDSKRRSRSHETKSQLRSEQARTTLHECEICPKKFTAKKNLTRHLMIHTGEKPFKCDECERSYRQAGELTTHLRTHRTENANQCDHCDKSFRNSSTLSNHRKYAHPVDSSNTRMVIS